MVLSRTDNEVLGQWTRRLCHALDPMEILPYLESTIMSEECVTSIMHETETRGRAMGVLRLIQSYQRNATGLQELVDALKYTSIDAESILFDDKDRERNSSNEQISRIFEDKIIKNEIINSCGILESILPRLSDWMLSKSQIYRIRSTCDKNGHEFASMEFLYSLSRHFRGRNEQGAWEDIRRLIDTFKEYGYRNVAELFENRVESIQSTQIDLKEKLDSAHDLDTENFIELKRVTIENESLKADLEREKSRFNELMVMLNALEFTNISRATTKIGQVKDDLHKISDIALELAGLANEKFSLILEKAKENLSDITGELSAHEEKLTTKLFADMNKLAKAKFSKNAESIKSDIKSEQLEIESHPSVSSVLNNATFRLFIVEHGDVHDFLPHLRTQGILTENDVRLMESKLGNTGQLMFLLKLLKTRLQSLDPLIEIMQESPHTYEPALRIIHRWLPQCPVCLDRYDYAPSLSCGHSVCLSCSVVLTKWRQKQEIIACPECRRETVVPKGGLPPNVEINRMAEEYMKPLHVKIVKSEMSPEMQSLATRLVAKPVRNNSKPPEVADHLKAMFEKKYAGTWICSAVKWLSDRTFGLCIGETNHFLCLQIQDLTVYLFQPQNVDLCWKCGEVRCDMRSCMLPDSVVTTSGLSEMDTTIASMFIRETMISNPDGNEVATIVKKYFDDNFTRPWQCIVTDGGRSGYHITHRNNQVIQISIGRARVAVFKY